LKTFSARALAEGKTDENLEASRWALEEANKMIRKMYAPTAKPADAPAAAPAAQPAKPAEPAAARHNLTTLTGMPAADKAPIADDVMSKIGSLEGEDLEKYMATLSSKEVERLMASAH
jgi:cell pole-organizing protein PopZ